MIRFLLAFLSWLGAFFRSRHDLGLELVGLWQQVGVLKRKNPRPRLTLCDRLFWLGFSRGWSKWASVRARGREARDRRRLTSHRVPLLLALPFAPPSRPTENHPRASPPHPVHGGRESDL